MRGFDNGNGNGNCHCHIMMARTEKKFRKLEN